MYHRQSRLPLFPSLCGHLLYSADSGLKWDNDRRSSYLLSFLFFLVLSCSFLFFFILFFSFFSFSLFLFLLAVLLLWPLLLLLLSLAVSLPWLWLVCAVWLTLLPFVSSAQCTGWLFWSLDLVCWIEWFESKLADHHRPVDSIIDSDLLAAKWSGSISIS